MSTMFEATFILLHLSDYHYEIFETLNMLEDGSLQINSLASSNSCM